MKTLKTLILLGFTVILFSSCQQKQSDEKITTKTDSVTTKPSDEYAMMVSNGMYKFLRVYYGNNKTEDFPFSPNQEKKDLLSLLNVNSTVDAMNSMEKKGWHMENSFGFGGEATFIFIFRKAK